MCPFEPAPSRRAPRGLWRRCEPGRAGQIHPMRPTGKARGAFACLAGRPFPIVLLLGFRAVSAPQPGILADVPAFTRYLTFRIAPGSSPRSLLEHVREVPVDDRSVIGLGHSFASDCGAEVPGLREAAALSGRLDLSLLEAALSTTRTPGGERKR